MYVIEQVFVVEIQAQPFHTTQAPPLASIYAIVTVIRLLTGHNAKRILDSDYTILSVVGHGGT